MLARLRERLPAATGRLVLGAGDDAAVTLPGGATATSVDAVIEGIHFNRRWATPAQIGHKALATALSDLAAMGAEPGEAYIAVGLPAELDEDWFMAALDGVLALAKATGTALAGGDVTRSPVLSLTVTVVGHAAEPDDFIRRDGARPGDLVVVTGDLGGAGAGLLLLTGKVDADAAEIEASHADGLIGRQIEPHPRLAAGRALAACGATAMIDLSDGLGADAGHIAAFSGLRLEIDLDRLPRAPGLDRVASAAGLDPESIAVGSGEDYELLATIPAARFAEAQRAVAASGSTLHEIGRATAGQGVRLFGAGDGRELPPTGFDQLAQP